MAEIKVKAPGLKETVRARLVAGESINEQDFPGFSEAYVKGLFTELRSEKYCGDGGPLNLVKDKETKKWRIAVL